MLFLSKNDLFNFFNCCSSTVVSISPHTLPCPTHPTLNPTLLWLCPWVLHTCSLMTLPLYPIILLPCPLWLWSVGSLFHCLWLYFAHLFALLIRFHSQMRSYGICLSPLAYFTQHNVLQFYPCCHKQQELILSFCCIVFHCVKGAFTQWNI